MAVLITLLLFPFFLQSVLANVGIPVIIWSDNDILAESPKPLAGHTLPSQYLSEQLNKVNVPDVGIVFQQDEFSAEDFLRFGKTIDQNGAFKNIKKFMNEESAVYYLPSVKAPINGLQSLRNKFSTVMELSNTDEAVKYMKNVALTKSTLYIIHLADTGSDENIGKAISDNDKIVGDIMAHVKVSGLTYMAVFTGKSHRKMREIVMQASGRHLLAVDENENSTITGNVTNCVILYAENIKTDNDAWMSSDVDITCTQDNKTATINIERGDKKITFEVIQAYGFWVVSDVKYDDKVIPLQTKGAVEFKAPLKMSYNCGVKRVYGDNSTVNVTISRIQLQVFESSKPGVFDSPYDCVGFFTLPIWTGLLTGLFLIAVTIAGIVMLGNINTFDLMDDPKGPPLTINVSE